MYTRKREENRRKGKNDQEGGERETKIYQKERESDSTYMTRGKKELEKSGKKGSRRRQRNIKNKPKRE